MFSFCSEAAAATNLENKDKKKEKEKKKKSAAEDAVAKAAEQKRKEKEAKEKKEAEQAEKDAKYLVEDAKCTAGETKKTKGVCDPDAKLTCLTTKVGDADKSAGKCGKMTLCDTPPDDKTVVDCPDVKWLAKDAACTAGAAEKAKKCDAGAKLTCLTTKVGEADASAATCRAEELCTTPPDDKTTVTCPDFTPPKTPE